MRIQATVVDDQAEIRISDTGHGMDSETLEKCFDPFFTTRDADKGTGLGLSIAYGIVKDHGGTIQVACEVNKGTSFTVCLPMAE